MPAQTFLTARPMTDPVAHQAGDVRLQGFAGGPGWTVAVAGAVVTLGFVGIMLAAAVIATSMPGTVALDVDFKVFWAAAKLVLGGEPLAVLDVDRLAAIHARSPEVWMPWLYPPGYLFLVAPLGAFSFSTAFILATALSTLLAALAIRPFVAQVTPLWIAVALAPAAMPALMIGQNSLLWMAGLLAALVALRSERWVLAGFLIGCLTLKPQLGLMLPLALLAIGAWRSILAATVTALVLLLLPTLVVGLPFWDGLADNIARQGSQVRADLAGLELLVGPVSLFTTLGFAPGPAMALHLGITIAAAVSVVLLWRERAVSFDARVAGLLTAMLLSAPFLWYYEAALMPVIGLFLLRAGILTFRPVHLILLLLLWIGAGLQAISAFLHLDAERLLGAVLIAPALLVSLALCLRHLVLVRSRGLP